MNCYPQAALERTMKIQEVILRAMAKKISWWEAAEIIGITDRQMRRWHWRYREYGYEGLLDRRLGKPRRVPLAVVEQVFALYREKYFDLNVRQFHEKLGAEHQIRVSYTHDVAAASLQTSATSRLFQQTHNFVGNKTQRFQAR